MKKNIWIINQYTGSPYYGMNYRSYYLAKELIQNEYSVTIFAGSYSHLFTNLPKSKGTFTPENIEGIDYIWVKTPKYKSSKSIARVFNMLVFMFRLLSFGVRSIKKPDIIIISSLSLFPIINAYIWSKIFKIEFILEVRDLWPLSLIEVGGFSKYHPLVLLLGWFEKFGYKKAKYVVSLLPNSMNYMQSRGMETQKFKYIPNGINLQEVQNYQDIDAKTLKSIPNDKFIVGYLGTIGIANALEYFLEAAEILKENHSIHFVLVGKGGEKSRFEQFCKDKKLSNVTFIDPIAKIQVQGMLGEFDLCYIGWHKEKMYEYGISANKIFDYMYSQKPILHSISIDNDIVESSGSGLRIEAENSILIAESILALSSMSNEELSIMGANAKEYVLKYHTYEALGKRYMELLD